MGGEALSSTSVEVKHKQPKLSAAEARRLASETLAYLDRYQKALADDAVMNKDALGQVFDSQEFHAISGRWTDSLADDPEVAMYMKCQNLLASASSYAHAQHDFAFNGLPEKDVLPLKKKFKQTLKDCKKSQS